MTIISRYIASTANGEIIRFKDLNSFWHKYANSGRIRAILDMQLDRFISEDDMADSGLLYIGTDNRDDRANLRRAVTHPSSSSRGKRSGGGNGPHRKHKRRGVAA